MAHQLLLILELIALQDFTKITLQILKIEFRSEEMDLKLLQKNEMMVTLSIMMGEREIAQQWR